MIDSLPPGLILIVGGLLLPLLRGKVQAAAMLLLPVLGLCHLAALYPLVPAEGMAEARLVQVRVLDAALTVVRLDKLSFVFGLIFHLAAVLGAIYALHVDDGRQNAAAMVYVGAAIAAVFAGDLVSLFVCWELTAVSSVFLIWSRGTDRAVRAGLRYLAVQVGSGVLLLAGLVLRHADRGTFAFEAMKLGDPGTLLIFLAFGIKCAFPLLHNWLQDAYPEATVTGTVFLSAFTTKLAVYALARGFPGTEILVPIGVAMTIFPIFFAVIENDLRRVLSYSLNNQVGFMVVGIGVGTPMALNGTVAHAFCHILYKALLFMSMGAVLFRAGTIKASELGGLHKSMPWTTLFCLVGAASISAFPFFNGFVSKGMTLSATAEGGYAVASILLLFASAGVLHHSGIRIPFHAFFGHDSGIRCKEAPPHMLLAMGLTAALCVGIGILPQPLYDLLPAKVVYHPYTASHVITQAQLLVFAVLAFAVLKRRNLEPPDLSAVNVDTDWFYRRLPKLLWRHVGEPVVDGLAWCRAVFLEALPRGFAALVGPEADGGRAPRSWPIGRVVATSLLMLLAYLLVVFVRAR